MTPYLREVIKLRQCLDRIDELEKHKEEIEREILRVSEPYLDALNLIRTFPRFNKNPFTAIQIPLWLSHQFLPLSFLSYFCEHEYHVWMFA